VSCRDFASILPRVSSVGGMKKHVAGGDMNRTMLLNAAVALGFVAATVAASLLAIGCTGASDTSAFAVRGSSTVAVTTTSGKPLRPLGRLNRQLPAGLHALDLVALDPANTGPALSRRKPTVLNGEWVAYATAAPGDQPRYHGWFGSDVFITRPGSQPKLVARRGRRGEIWNVCPAFSPNGRMLAFGSRAPARSDDQSFRCWFGWHDRSAEDHPGGASDQRARALPQVVGQQLTARVYRHQAEARRART
jgi:hypothetical protein